MAQTLDQQIERLRLEGVKEGRLFDCYLKWNAARIDIEGFPRCRGYEIGEGGRHVAGNCEKCTFYYPRSYEKVN